jgi:hypothetical protein
MARQSRKPRPDTQRADTVDAEVVEEHADADPKSGETPRQADPRTVRVRVASTSAPQPAKQISPEARLLRGAFRVAGLAVGTAVHTAQAAVGTTLDVGKQIAQVALDGESQADLAEFAGSRLRELARDTLGLGEPPVREVVSYVPVGTTDRDELSRSATTAALRRRGDELLALSADVSYSDEVHPAFSTILDQLAPDEARVLRFLAVNGPQPIVDVRTNRPLGIGSELVAANLTSVPVQAGVRHPDRARSYLINLERLGLIAIRSEPVLLSRYMVLEVQPVVTEAMRRAGRAPKIVRKSLQLTEFGDDFCRTCFTLDRRALLSGPTEPTD